MPIQFQDLTLGEELVFLVYTDPLSDLTSIPITVVMDSPDGTTRFVFRYLNGGSDGVLESSNQKCRFTKTSAWTAANLSAGPWKVRFLTGLDSTTQDEIGWGIKKIIRPEGGPLPTSH